MGPTILIGSAAFLLLIILVIVVVVIARRAKSSSKVQERLKKLKYAVFYNPIIRYLVLNSLKLNMSAIVVLRSSDRSMLSFAFAIATLAILNGLPFVYYIILNRNHDELTKEENRKSYGALYAGKNVSRDDHRAQFYPMLFFWRRALFISATVYMFSYPLMQMYAHYALTMSTMIIMLSSNHAFESVA